MTKTKTIGKENMGTRLFTTDEAYIKSIVKKNRFIDKRFENNSAAIRYYVELGIAAENPAENSAEDLKHRIIRSSQKGIIGEQLVPLTEAIETLFERMNIFDKNQTDYFTDSATRFKRFENHLEREFEVMAEQLATGLKSVFEYFAGSEKTGDETLRNLIVLRSVFYVFLLGHKKGEIEPGKENLVKWDRIINLAHEKANELSIKEVKMLSSEALGADTIQIMAQEIFREVKALSEPKTE